MQKILIVGGGSSGWIVASYLNAVLRRAGEPLVDIALIEAPGIGRIGVGEATVPTIRNVLQAIGVEEKTFMKEADATFKQAIRFNNWHHQHDDGYYHPFDRHAMGPVDRIGADWLSSDQKRPFSEFVSPQPQLCDLGLAPKMPGARDFASPMPYAYHMDAEKFADYLCRLATSRGVGHYQDRVTDIRVGETGHIEAVHTEGGLELKADLFIDCTGFASLLIEKTLGSSLVDYSPWLLCDRAVAMRVPYDQFFSGHIRPYTTATALSAGWVWDIGLVNRRGTGYVYSSQFLDDDDAAQELKAHEGPHADDIEPRLLKFYVGRREEQWRGNCVAMGLASGFIEPLESTGLYLVEYAALMLAEHFPYKKDSMPVLAARYNAILNQRYEEILDFVNLHYCLTARSDTPFWQEVQRPERVTERLAAKLDFWRHKAPSGSDFDDHLRLFSHQSYEHILYGMGFRADEAQKGISLGQPQSIANIVEAAKPRLPRHEAWLHQELGHTIPPATQ